MNTQTPESRRHLIKFFINKFEKTKENDWTTGIRCNSQGQRCALGMTHDPDNWKDTPETIALGTLFNEGSSQSGQWRIACINNGENGSYCQATPRQRILAALHDKLKECL